MDASTTAAAIAAEHHERLFHWAHSLCRGNREEAMEVVQQVYLEVLEGRLDLTLAKDPRAYLYGAARRVCASRRRKGAVWSQLLRLVGQAKEPPRPAEPTMIDKLTAHKLGRLLDQLPERQRQVAELVFGHDLTVEAAAGAMGVSVGSARTHYHRAKERLQVLVEVP